ncbi:uncharacterized protein LOC122855154 [Aphidius gifuensis]|uniref:uncharacterized protein LOC122855154 n=1 Tax=Aphidius gifuensis TaxID=684658 RepID=UPI001CDCB057|nr:uncharacterized protein LOC122855154 [Aphidius gifuensis]
METIAIDTQWIETFKLISKEEVESPTKIHKNDVRPRITDTVNESNKILSESQENFFGQRHWRMMRMQPLFSSQPRLEKICNDWKNNFVDSGFTTYNFLEPIDKSFEDEEDDFKYLINLCGCTLTSLNLYYYPVSSVMQLIKSKCPNLNALLLRFKEVESKDFDDVFSNMSHLETLIINWPRKNLTFPMTLIKSLEQVCETLKTLFILCEGERSWLSDRTFTFDSLVLAPETEALMDVIGNMKNLKCARISLEYGFTDELFMKLTNNCKNLISLKVRSPNITDKGLIAVNNLKRLEYFSLDLMGANIENNFITDRSVQCLFNNNMEELYLPNCIKITNSSVIELVKNLPNLRTLDIRNTKATIEVVEEVAKLLEDSEISLTIYVSFKINDYNSFVVEWEQPFFVVQVNRALRFKSSFRDNQIQ